MTRTIELNSAKEGFKIVTPGRSLTRYSEATVYYVKERAKYIIAEDDLGEIVLPIEKILRRLLKGDLEIPATLKVGAMGLEWNIWTHNMPMEGDVGNGDVYPDYWVWSSQEYQTWAYNVSGKIVFEVSPSYKWHFASPRKEERPISSFEKFQREYAPIAIIEVENSTAALWAERCRDIAAHFC